MERTTPGLPAGRCLLFLLDPCSNGALSTLVWNWRKTEIEELVRSTSCCKRCAGSSSVQIGRDWHSPKTRTAIERLQRCKKDVVAKLGLCTFDPQKQHRNVMWWVFRWCFEKRGTPKRMVYNWKPYYNWLFGGTTVFGNTTLKECFAKNRQNFDFRLFKLRGSSMMSLLAKRHSRQGTLWTFFASLPCVGSWKGNKKTGEKWHLLFKNAIVVDGSSWIILNCWTRRLGDLYTSFWPTCYTSFRCVACNPLRIEILWMTPGQLASQTLRARCWLEPLEDSHWKTSHCVFSVPKHSKVVSLFGPQIQSLFFKL